MLRRFGVDALLDGGDHTADPSFRALEDLADERGIERIPATAPPMIFWLSWDSRVALDGGFTAAARTPATTPRSPAPPMR